MTDVVQWVFLVAATEAATEILVAAKITDGLRAFIFRLAFPAIPDNYPSHKDPPRSYAVARFVNDLLKCGYCTSVWVAMFFASFAPTVFDNVLVNWLVNFIAIHRLSNWFHVVYSLVSKGRIKTHDLDVTVRVENGSFRPVGGEERDPPGP